MKFSNEAKDKKSQLKRLFLTTKKAGVQKAMIIENNNVYTYGYGKK